MAQELAASGSGDGQQFGHRRRIAKRLASEGVRLVRPWPQCERAHKVADEIRATGAEVHVAIGDLARDDQRPRSATLSRRRWAGWTY